jgi:hypothetical protein
MFGKSRSVFLNRFLAKVSFNVSEFCKTRLNTNRKLLGTLTNRSDRFPSTFEAQLESDSGEFEREPTPPKVDCSRTTGLLLPQKSLLKCRSSQICFSLMDEAYPGEELAKEWDAW